MVDKVSAICNECRTDMDSALPALEAALRALEHLNRSDITELRTFSKPPDAVKRVMDAVMLLLGEQQQPAAEGWEHARKIMGQRGFLWLLLNFDKDNVSPAVEQQLQQKFLSHPDFLPDVVSRSSRSCACLCGWVLAIAQYTAVTRNIQPKRQKFQGAEARLAAVMAEVQTKQAAVEAATARLAKLRSDTA